MLAEPMSLEKAHEIAQAIRSGRAKYGAQYSPPYRPYEVVEACVRLLEQCELEVRLREHMAPKEDLTKANRQLAACEARVAKLSKKYGGPDVQD